jgi:hypothetical protein
MSAGVSRAVQDRLTLLTLVQPDGPASLDLVVNFELILQHLVTGLVDVLPVGQAILSILVNRSKLSV